MMMNLNDAFNETKTMNHKNSTSKEAKPEMNDEKKSGNN